MPAFSEHPCPQCYGRWGCAESELHRWCLSGCGWIKCLEPVLTGEAFVEDDPTTPLDSSEPFNWVMIWNLVDTGEPWDWMSAYLEMEEPFS